MRTAASLGALFVMLGLVMPRVRRNPWVGVRTPWTLASDENWARTHRFAVGVHGNREDAPTHRMHLL